MDGVCVGQDTHQLTCPTATHWSLFPVLGALRLSPTDTVLIYVGIPAAIVLVVVALAMAGGGRSPNRYRPGRPFEFTPVWFLSSPQDLAEPSTTIPALPTSLQPPALASGDAGGKATAAPAGTTGGASDRW